MPQAINITVKDGQSTPADTLFTLLTPAAGTNPAVWVARTKGPTTACQPRVDISSEGFKGGRRVRVTIKVPSYTVGSDGKVSIEDAWHAAAAVTIPDRVPASFRADGAAYLANVLAAAIVKESNIDGYAPA